MSILLALPLLAASAPADAAVQRAASLSGEWTVDLRVSLSDAPYSQPMKLNVTSGGKVAGEFYNSEILAGKTGSGQGRTCLAFRTTDGKGFYHSSACLVEGRMVGQTWSEGREFVLPWTAERR